MEFLSLKDIPTLAKEGKIKHGDEIEFIADVACKKIFKLTGNLQVLMYDSNTCTYAYVNPKEAPYKKTLFKEFKINKETYVKGTVDFYCDYRDDKSYKGYFCIKVNDANSNTCIVKALNKIAMRGLMEKYKPLYDLVYNIGIKKEENALKVFHSYKELRDLVKNNKDIYFNLIYLAATEGTLMPTLVKSFIDCGLNSFEDLFGANLAYYLAHAAIDDSAKYTFAKKKIYADIILYFLEKTNFNSNKQDCNEDTTLSTLCMDDAFIEPVKYLLSKPEINVNVKNDVGWTTIGEAIRHKSQNIVNELLKRKDLVITIRDINLAKKFNITLNQ